MENGSKTPNVSQKHHSATPGLAFPVTTEFRHGLKVASDERLTHEARLQSQAPD